MNSTALIYRTLAADPVMIASLASYTPRGGRAALAIFNDVPPDDFVFSKDNPKPCLVISAPVDIRRGGTFTERDQMIEQEVRAYAWRGFSTADLDTVAQRVATLFHLRHNSLSITGGRVTSATARGPAQAPTTDAAVSGRRITLQLEIQEN